MTLEHIHESFYDAVLVDRIPQAAGEPDFKVIDRFPALGNIAWSKELNEEGGASISTRPERISDLVKTRLLDPGRYPMELWVYRDGDLVSSGPVIGYQYQGQFKTLTLHSRGLLYYLRYIILQSNFNFSEPPGEDPFVIIKNIIDAWQNLSYGHFGIDTSTIGTSTLTREVKYQKIDILSVRQIVRDLSDSEDGFDFAIDPETREFLTWEGSRGTNKTKQFVVDARNLRQYSLFFSLVAGEFGSEVFGSARHETDVFWATAANTTTRQQFGRTAVGASVNDVEKLSELQKYVNSLRDQHSKVTLSFGGSGGSSEGEGTRIIPVEGMTPKDIDPGDTIGVTVDLGFGQFVIERDVYAVYADVDIDGKENMNVALL